MELKNGRKTFYAPSRQDWRQWLLENHRKEKSVWLIIYKKGSGTPTVNYQEAVEEALCFGWIDSKPNKRDDHSYYQFFSRRNPKSNWSMINKRKVEKLIASDLMTDAGYEMIRIAKQNVTWNALDEIENLILPADLVAALRAEPGAYGNWEKFPGSVRRGILEWILNAKTAETRLKRIRETSGLAAKNIRANQYRKKPDAQ